MNVQKSLKKIALFDPPAATKPLAETTVAATAELLEHLSRRIAQKCYAKDLTPAQWSVLRFVYRANMSACTVTAFAAFHSVQQGSASQTVATLLKKRLLRFEANEIDRRVKFMRLTAAGERMVQHDPLRSVEEALRGVKNSDLTGLLAAAHAIILHLAD